MVWILSLRGTASRCLSHGTTAGLAQPIVQDELPTSPALNGRAGPSVIGPVDGRCLSIPVRSRRRFTFHSRTTRAVATALKAIRVQADDWATRLASRPMRTPPSSRRVKDLDMGRCRAGAE